MQPPFETEFARAWNTPGHTRYQLSPSDTVDAMTRRSAMRGFNFPYLKDADARGPQLPGGLHPHAVVLYSDLAIAYSGRIDDLRPGAAGRSRDLEAVLADIAAGRPVASRRRRRPAAASSGRPPGPIPAASQPVGSRPYPAR